MSWSRPLKPLPQTAAPVIKKPVIALYLPTRNRAFQCSAVLLSWVKMAADPANIKIIVGVDYDDTTSQEEMKRHGYDTVIFGEEVITNGERARILGESLDADIYLAIVDYWFSCTPGWDNHLRAIMGNNEVVNLACVHEITSFNFTAISRKWRDYVNPLESPLFPFWMCDQWRLEMACYVFNKSPEMFQSISCYGKHERTNNLYELDFWWGLFHALRPLRLKQCHEIAMKYGYAHPDFKEFLESRKKQIDAYTNLDFTRRPSIPATEAQFRDPRPMSQKYLKAKARADKYITDNGLEIWKMLPLF